MDRKDHDEEDPYSSLLSGEDNKLEAPVVETAR